MPGWLAGPCEGLAGWAQPKHPLVAVGQRGRCLSCRVLPVMVSGFRMTCASTGHKGRARLLSAPAGFSFCTMLSALMLCIQVEQIGDGVIANDGVYWTTMAWAVKWIDDCSPCASSCSSIVETHLLMR